MEDLFYLRARYYDPSTGQFISRDPAVGITRQPYAYTYDNPLNLTDPSGLMEACLPWGGCVDIPTPVVVAGGALDAPIAGLVILTSLASQQIRNGEAIFQPVTTYEDDPNAGIDFSKRSKQSGKEAASDIPSWAGQPQPGENGKTYARRECDAQFGPGNYETGPKSAYNELKKYGDRKIRN